MSTIDVVDKTALPYAEALFESSRSNEQIEKTNQDLNLILNFNNLCS